jgi:tetratricopeptide (TPR) repeat protein/transcriptional regulator with XRE-family HTH domain
VDRLEVTSHVATRMRQLRRQRGWSALQLAEACAQAGLASLTRSTIAKIESGVRQSVTAEEIAVLARVFGVTPTDLVAPEGHPSVDFFIDYSPADEQWATWIAWQLEAAGHRTLIHAWDFVPGTNFIDFMDRGVRDAAVIVAILSGNYLKSRYGDMTWQATLRTDLDKLVPVRVEDCPMEGPLATVTYLDLVDISDPAVASEVLLTGLRYALAGRAKPVGEPVFPPRRTVLGKVGSFHDVALATEPVDRTREPEGTPERQGGGRRAPTTSPLYPRTGPVHRAQHESSTVLHAPVSQFGQGMEDPDEPGTARDLQDVNAHDTEVVPVPGAVTHLWRCVKKALAANEDPSPRRIDRMASAAGLELAGNTIAGWFETWSVVPSWEKFEVLVKALAAEHDEDWRSLHKIALTADRERKREQRRRKELGRATTSASFKPMATEEHPDRQSSIHELVPAAMSWFVMAPADQFPARPLVASVPRQLPADVAHFTGRAAELATLDALLAQNEAAQPAAMVIVVVAGTAGVGKTALVVHWAHRVRDLFPDGQLFVNLRGYDPGAPMAPEQALEEFLRALNVPAERIPAGLGERAALYRSLLDGRRVLIVLDNANAAKQVRPLLPGSSTCRVVVTSRSRLSGLIAHDGASRVTVDLLPPAEAIALLRDVIGTARVAAEPDATAELASRCAYLPLALRIAAERAATHPHVTLAGLVSELAVVHDRLNLLTTADEEDEEDEATAVRAVFSWSYHALSPEAARAFRLLGLHTGPDISVPAAAALTDTTPIRARRLLGTLVGKHLIEETGRDRYRLHNLLRFYAAERAKAEETDHDCDTAVRRVLTWYLHTGDAADRVLDPHRRRILLDRPEVVCSPLEFTTYSQALDWCEAERANLVAAIRQAAETGEHVIAWKLPVALLGFFNLRKRWADLITTHGISLAAAQRLHDRRGEAWSWGGLGLAHLDLRQYKEALDCYQHALHICQEIDDPWGEAIALLALGRAYLYLGQYEEALGYSQHALRICQESDDPWGQTRALINIGTIHRKLHCFEDALGYFQRTLDVVRPIRHHSGEAMALHNLGDTYRDLQRFEDALEYFQRACATYRQISDRWGEAQTLRNIGDTLQKLDQMGAAAEYWRQALSIFEDLEDSTSAVKIRTSLAILDANNPD